MQPLWFPVAGGTFLFPLDKQKAHLQVILMVHKEEVLFAPVCSLRECYSDEITSCRLRKGEHPFIRHESFVHFRFARLAGWNEALLWVREGRAKPYECLAENVWAHVVQQALGSRAMKRKFRRWLEEALRNDI